MFVEFFWVFLFGSLFGLELIGKVFFILYIFLMSGVNVILGIIVLVVFIVIIKVGNNIVVLFLGFVLLGFVLFNVIGGFFVIDWMLVMFSCKFVCKENC